VRLHRDRRHPRLQVPLRAGREGEVQAPENWLRSWSASANFQELELPLLGLLVTETAFEDAPDLGEVARPACALRVDGLDVGAPLSFCGGLHFPSGACA